MRAASRGLGATPRRGPHRREVGPGGLGRCASDPRRQSRTPRQRGNRAARRRQDHDLRRDGWHLPVTTGHVGRHLGLGLRFFPELSGRLCRDAGLLSGDQQKMFCLAMAPAQQPKVLCLGDPSLALTPLIIERLLLVVRGAADGGIAVLPVGHHARKDLAVAGQATVLSHRPLVTQGTGAVIRADFGLIGAGCLGVTPEVAGGADF